MSSLAIEVKACVLKGLERTFEEEMKKCVLKLSEKYNFNSEEALSMLGYVKMFEKNKEKVKKEEKSFSKQSSKPSFPLPWCGKINEECCYGVKPNHGLFSQCQNKPVSGKGTGVLYGKLCSTCLKQCEKNKHGKPNGGLITERSGDFKSPSGKSPVVYSVVMKKLEITKEAAMEEASKFGLEIPEEEFEFVEKKRGRPAVCEKSEAKGEKVKKRGRPKKEKRQVSVSNAEELLKSLEEQGEAVTSNVEIANKVKASPQTPPTPVPEVEEDEVEEGEVEESEVEESGSEEEINVVPVEIEGNEYYMLEEEANKEGCEVMDESGEVMGRYKKTKNGGTLCKKGKRLPKNN